MAKQAFVIVGPESSGTRLMARLFIAAGCYGDDGHAQRLDALVDGGKCQEPLIVLRRSYPYAKQWPEMRRIKEKLEFAGYQVRVVLIVRSLLFTALANHRAMHTKSMGKALARSTEALRRILLQLAETRAPYVWVTYESLVRRPQEELQWLFDWAGLPVPSDVEIFDGNANHV